jgi:hypothetical protein
MKIEQLTLDLGIPQDGSDAQTGKLRMATYRHILSLMPSGSLLDLGAGHCKFAIIARDKRYSVTAVDARDERVPYKDLGTIVFSKSDVRQFPVRGYNVILMLGLLYHMTLADQRDLLRRASTSITVIDTQLRDANVKPTSSSDGWHERLVREQEYEGVQFRENEKNPIGGVGNAYSFWHTRESLLRLLEASGYSKTVVIQPPYRTKYGARQWFLAYP